MKTSQLLTSTIYVHICGKERRFHQLTNTQLRKKEKRKKRKKRQVISKIKHSPLLLRRKQFGLINVASLHNHYKICGGALQISKWCYDSSKIPKTKPLQKTSIKHNPTNKQTKKTPKITRLLQQHQQLLLLLQHTNTTNIFLPTLCIPKCGSRVVILVCGK